MDATKSLRHLHVKRYLILTKPGIIAGNAITAIGGFAFGLQGQWNLSLLLITLFGLTLVIASGCVFNNYIDRKHDRLMQRTQSRPLAQQTITEKNALIFGALLGIIGLCALSSISLLATLIASFGFAVYVLVYSNAKYKTAYATLLGTLAGVAPALTGYCAAAHQFDFKAVILFAIMTLWQMPHFLAISLFREEDYRAAAIPTLAINRGVFATKLCMLIYTLAFAIAVLLPTLCGFKGIAYLVVAGLLGTSWIWLAIVGFGCKNDQRWARQMFFFSLAIILLLFTALAL